MRAGKLRHRVTIQRLETIKNQYGDVTKEWVDVATTWVSIEPLRGEKRFHALQILASASHEVIMRALPKQLRPKPGNRLLFGDRILDIYSVLDVDERGRTLGLLCVEQVESE